MTTEPLVLLEIQDHVAVVLLNRPRVLNAVDGAMAVELENIVRRIETDRDIRAAVLASASTKAFCAGADLKSALDEHAPPRVTPTGGFAGFCDHPRAKPWIAAVEGAAVGGGFEIVLACDMVVASTTAFFGLPEVKRGLMAGAGGAWRLPRKVPINCALEMLTTGDPIDGARAYAVGLANRLVPAGGARTEAIALAKSISTASPLAVRETLAVARLDATEDELKEASRQSIARVRESPDAREGPAAFLERRSPVWASS